MNIENLKKEALLKLDQAIDLKGLENIEKEYLGKKGKIRDLSLKMKDLTSEERKELGVKINELSNFLEDKVELKKRAFKLIELEKKEEMESLDITFPATRKFKRGHVHPLSIVKKEIEDIFTFLGFSIIDGPELEDEWHNFDALNIPENHPAREMQDTFFIKQKNRGDIQSNKEKYVLRTHTSNVQTRYMENHVPPFRVIAPGRVFRYEATDASHETCFNQVEGLLVDENISIANLKAVLERFLQEFFRNLDVRIRLRPSYFPFVEPGFEVDMSCVVCNGKGCPICSGGGWIEILGAGMVHPNVFKNCGLNPENLTGFAFGIAIDRLAMMKYKIDDIRWFHSGDMRFLKQF